MPFRLLARAAPFLLGAIAAAIWLHRRRLRELRVPPPAALPAAPAQAVEIAVPAAAPVEVAVPAAQALELSVAAEEPLAVPFVRPPTARFVRSARRPVDIVTIVDDLLATAR